LIGLDTNVLVRYLVKDDPQQGEMAASFIRKTIESGESCYINHIVLCELVWVLESAYKYKKQDIVGILEKLLITKQFDIEIRDIVRHALFEYKLGNGDLADYLIGWLNKGRGCNTTITFDADLKTCDSFQVL
jgi:predicted nucleic-acid-binding protein